MTFKVPAVDLSTEQLLDRLQMLNGTRDMMDDDEWAASYGTEFARTFAILDARLSDNACLPTAWRWARTPA